MTDWARLMPDVARRLLGEPPRKTAREWRYGRKGSLVVHVGDSRVGSWHDFEADEGGGVLALIRHKLACDQAGALRWLEVNGLIPAKNGKTPSEPLRAPEAARPIPGPRVSAPNPPSEAHGRASPAPRTSTTPIARRIVAGSGSADGTPAARYLSQRGTWPDGGAGPLPDAVRWCPRSSGVLPGTVPESAAGLLVWILTDCDAGQPVTNVVMVEALTGGGQRTEPRWRRNYGAVKGRAVQLGDPEPLALAVVEGPADALALARLRLPGLMIRAATSTAGFGWAAAGWGGPVVVIPDGGRAGRDAARRVTGQRNGRPCYRVLTGPDGDPDDWLRDAPGDVVADAVAALRGRLEDTGGIPGDALARALAWALQRLARRDTP